MDILPSPLASRALKTQIDSLYVKAEEIYFMKVWNSFVSNSLSLDVSNFLKTSKTLIPFTWH